MLLTSRCGDLPGVAAFRPLDHQRHLHQWIVHVIALEQHMVVSQVLAVIGRKHDQRVVVEAFSFSKAISRPT